MMILPAHHRSLLLLLTTALAVHCIEVPEIGEFVYEPRSEHNEQNLERQIEDTRRNDELEIRQQQNDFDKRLAEIQRNSDEHMKMEAMRRAAIDKQKHAQESGQKQEPNSQYGEKKRQYGRNYELDPPNAQDESLYESSLPGHPPHPPPYLAPSPGNGTVGALRGLVQHCDSNDDCRDHSFCWRQQCTCNFGYVLNNKTGCCELFRCCDGKDCRLYFPYAECRSDHECICDSGHSLDEKTQSCRNPADYNIPVWVVYILAGVVAVILVVVIGLAVFVYCYVRPRKQPFDDSFPERAPDGSEPGSSAFQNFLRAFMRGNYRRMGGSFSSTPSISNIDPCDGSLPRACPAPPPYEETVSTPATTTIIQVVGGGCGGSRQAAERSAPPGSTASESESSTEINVNVQLINSVSPLSPKINF